MVTSVGANVCRKYAINTCYEVNDSVGDREERRSRYVKYVEGWDHVNKVHQVCYVLHGMCESCRCVMRWASDCLNVCVLVLASR
jgi:hypothetical protein